MKRTLLLFVSIAALGLPACRAPEVGDLDEIHEKLDAQAETQKKILSRLDELGKPGKAAPKKRPGRPEIDFNKVHKIPVAGSPTKGKEGAKVTIAEFSDFQ